MSEMTPDDTAVPHANPNQPVATSTDEPVQSASPTPRRAWLLPTIVGVAALVVGVVLGSTITGVVTTAQQEAAEKAAADSAEKAKSSLFADAAGKCGISQDVEIADQGRTLIVDGAGEDFGSGDVDFSGLDCIIDALDTPAAVRELMYSTRSLDGRQVGEWDDISASWSYHPDNGLDIIFELAG